MKKYAETSERCPACGRRDSVAVVGASPERTRLTCEACGWQEADPLVRPCGCGGADRDERPDTCSTCGRKLPDPTRTAFDITVTAGAEGDDRLELQDAIYTALASVAALDPDSIHVVVDEA